MSVTRDRVAAAFITEYGRTPRLFSAPGRVNLIGEHTDYNDGFVLPLAIDRRTFVAAAPRADRRLRVLATDLGARAAVSLDEPREVGTPRFMDYVEGVARALTARRHHVAGADLAIASDVPLGAGLSSSAALEVATGFALAALSGTELPLLELALAAQQAEHEYAGSRCGVMDQYIAALGREGHALLVDCRTLQASPAPMVLGQAVLLVCNSRVKHDLVTSAYNDRRSECEQAAALLGVRALRDVTAETLEARRGELPKTTYRRTRHVVHENARTLAAVEDLRMGDLHAVGQHMLGSHASLRDDYEVSAPELDLLVEVAAGHPGVHGARLTGAGFGGCTITLVDGGAAAALAQALDTALTTHFGMSPEIFVTRAEGGVRED